MDWLANRDIVENLLCLIVVTGVALALVISAIKGKLSDWL